MELQQFFKENPKAALAFSGGVDSAYLLYAACEAGAKVQPFFLKTVFQPRFELEDARRLTKELGVELTVIELDILARSKVAENTAERCYHCKRALFECLAQEAGRQGFSLLLDGTNASDDAGDRPGMRALAELSVRSPLRECGLRKEEIRRLSHKAGLFTWNKPAYACLATRIPTGCPLEAGLLARVEEGEARLWAIGFQDFRLRVYGTAARLQLREEQFDLAVKKQAEIRRQLAPYFKTVLLDLRPR